MFVLNPNVGKTATGDPLFPITDAAGKTHLVTLTRENGILQFAYYKTEDIKAVTPANGIYAGVSRGGGIVNSLQVSTATVNALTGTGHPDGTALSWQAGRVSDYFPAITNLSWIPISGADGTISVATINADNGSGNPTGKIKAVETVVSNLDGTITVSGIKLGDKISVDGGTLVVATGTEYTTGVLKNGSHKVIVTALSTGNYYYDTAGNTVTTKIAFFSAPKDWIMENPILSLLIAIGFILLGVYLVVPLLKGEPIFGGMFEDGMANKTLSKPKNRRFISA